MWGILIWGTADSSYIWKITTISYENTTKNFQNKYKNLFASVDIRGVGALSTTVWGVVKRCPKLNVAPGDVSSLVLGRGARELDGWLIHDDLVNVGLSSVKIYKEIKYILMFFFVLLFISF